MCLAFVYDIFWVFGSTHIFGDSVMAYVATKLDVPIKIEMPHFKEEPIQRCSLIGLGDMVLPGILVAFAFRHDIILRTTAYYFSGVAGYILGIGACGLVIALFGIA